MIANFNIEKLNQLLSNFHELTGFTVSIWDENYNQLSYYPKKYCAFCRLIKSSQEGKKRCAHSDWELCKKCAQQGAPVSHYCHAGLLDTAIPIKFENRIMGYMLFGQINDETPKTAQILQFLQQLSTELKIDAERLTSAYLSTQTFDQQKIVAAANLLDLATRHLWLSDYIKIDQETLSAKIRAYIESNLDKALSVQELCKQFSLSKNKLYHLSHQTFGKTIGEYITSLRIERAKQLLSTTNIPVNQIATAVGIVDYNYFSKLFKQYTELTPVQFRKR